MLFSLHGTKNTMSHKTKSKAPRKMPVDVILTRNKSAQLKQLKVYKNTKLEAQKELLEVNRKRKISGQEVELKESPNKPKRMELKKVMLKPKHTGVVIADMTKLNKRKLNVPKKDLPQASPSMSPPSDTQESVLELITLLEATQEMSEEDFLEILTCPSPVWWEDPPPGYSEDPISAEYTRKNIESNTDNKNVSKTCSKYTNDVKFLNKSKKLEALVGNIKKRNVCDNNVNKTIIRITEGEKSIAECIELNSDETDQEDLANVSLDDTTLYYLENIEIPIVNT